MRTLVAAPTARVKDYALPFWAAATSQYDRLVVTDEPDYEEVVRNLGIRTVAYTPSQCFGTIYGPQHADAWRAILDNADGYTHILSLEIDVIPDCDILELMEVNYEPDFTCHLYPWHPPRTGYAYEMGCTLASVETWKAALKATHPEHGLYRTIHDFNCKHIHLTELQHIH